MHIGLELLVLLILVVVVGIGPGWLVDLHQAQMTQTGVQWWGKQRGGTVGTTESVVVHEYLPLKDYGRINWNYRNISRDFAAVPDMAVGTLYWLKITL